MVFEKEEARPSHIGECRGRAKQGSAVRGPRIAGPSIGPVTRGHPGEGGRTKDTLGEVHYPATARNKGSNGGGGEEDAWNEAKCTIREEGAEGAEGRAASRGAGKGVS